jgi:hypothetical protein
MPPTGHLTKFYNITPLSDFSTGYTGRGYSDKFILKGALMFLAWGASIYRPTRDIDFLGFTTNDLEAVAEDYPRNYVSRKWSQMASYLIVIYCQERTYRGGCGL